MNLYPHQQQILDETARYNRVGIFLDMGLGKTFVSSEKLKQLAAKLNVIVCQKSLVKMWENHFKTHYPEYNIMIYKNQDLTNLTNNTIIITTYDLIWRRSQFIKLSDITLLLDESQLIKNPSAKRTKFIMSLKFKNIILSSGTPCSGRYEELLTQCKLLGWNISKRDYYDKYIITKQINVGQPYPIEIVTGYKNVEELKSKLREYGAVFMKTEDVLNLPEQIETTIAVENTKEYRTFKKDSIITIDDKQLIGDTSLTQLLYLRQLAGLYNKNKLQALKELLESTNDRVVIFYNFKEEFNIISKLCSSLQRSVSYINGNGTDLKNYESTNESITLVQYQSGSSGVNLQLANKIVYYSLTLSAEMYMQSMKRIHRIGQNRTCFYYYLITTGSIEEKILQVLKQREDYTLALFEKG